MHISHIGTPEAVDIDGPVVVLSGSKEEVKAAATMFLDDVVIVRRSTLTSIMTAAENHDVDACHALAWKASQ